jgi:hypothetical protein
MLNHRFVVAALALLLVCVCVTPSTEAGATLSNVNQVTFSAPVALPGVILLPGKYMFEAGAVGMNPNIVRVTSADYQKLYFVGFTQRVPRPSAMGRNEVIALGEATAGTPTPIRAWYPIGLQSGHEFLYR